MSTYKTRYYFQTLTKAQFPRAMVVIDEYIDKNR